MPDKSAFCARLERGANDMGIPLTGEQLEQFYAYYRMLVEANARFNLTRVGDDVDAFVDRNLLDCLTPLSNGLLDGARTLIDVGTGAGFPGLPIAIAHPETEVTLLDALDKRVRFLDDVVKTLGLHTMTRHGRAEDAAREPDLRERFDVATARAVASVDILSELLLPFVRVGGHMLALKGPNAEAELRDAAFALQTLGTGEATLLNAEVPERDWQHKLVWIQKLSNTPEKYPRRAGLPEKRPLRI